MKKIYSCKLISLIIVLFFTYAVNAQALILYVSDGTDDSSDTDMIDSLISWGYDVDHLNQTDYDLAPENVYDGVDGIFFGESVDSKRVNRFGPNPDMSNGGNQDNFPVDFITLEGGAMLFDQSRWGILAEGSEIIINKTGEAGQGDLQLEVIDNTHYITSHLNVGDVITWSNAEPALVPYFADFAYVVRPLTIPVVQLKTSVSEADVSEAYTMGVVTINDGIHGFFCTMTHSLIADQHGTPEFFKIIHKAADHIYTGEGVGLGNRKISDQAPEILAFPNPASKQMTVRFRTKRASDVRVSLYDVSGKLIESLYEQRSVPGNNFVFIDTEKYSDGFYLIRFDIEGRSAFSKVVIR